MGVAGSGSWGSVLAVHRAWDGVASGRWWPARLGPALG